MMNAKMQTLDKIIDMMDEHMLGRAKKPGMPAPLAEKPSADADATITATTIEAPKDEIDPEMLRKLMEMYSEDEDDQADEPADVNGEY